VRCRVGVVWSGDGECRVYQNKLYQNTKQQTLDYTTKKRAKGDVTRITLSLTRLTRSEREREKRERKRRKKKERKEGRKKDFFFIMRVFTNSPHTHTCTHTTRN